MPIEVKELVVRAWVDTQPKDKQEMKQAARSGSETSPMNSEMLEQLKRMLTDIKDR
jgi:hypothetical protein